MINDFVDADSRRELLAVLNDSNIDMIPISHPIKLKDTSLLRTPYVWKNNLIFAQQFLVLDNPDW